MALYKVHDNIAFLRDVWDFRNLLLVEQPNGDFGQTLLRQFLFDAWHSIQLRHLINSKDARVAAIAAKAIKTAIGSTRDIIKPARKLAIMINTTIIVINISSVSASSSVPSVSLIN